MNDDDWPKVVKCDNKVGHANDMPCSGVLLFNGPSWTTACTQCKQYTLSGEGLVFHNIKPGGPYLRHAIYDPDRDRFPVTLIPANGGTSCMRCGITNLQEFERFGWGTEYVDRDGSLCCSWLCEPYGNYGNQKHVPLLEPTPEEVQGAINSILNTARAHDAS